MVSAPNGFFYRNLVWYDLPRGDALLVKGFRISLQDLSGAGVELINSFHSAMSNLLFSLPDGLHMQSQWRVTSDYRDALEPFQQRTSETAVNDWSRFSREEIFYRLSEQAERGQLRREEHILWFSKHVPTPLGRVLSTAASVERHIEMLAEREDTAFGHLQRALQQSFGSFGQVTPLSEEEHFLNYRNFLNPSLRLQTREAALKEFDPEATIQDLTFRSDGIALHDEHASFHFAGHYHTLFAISRWPARVRPLDVLAITQLPFNDYVITTNVIPQNTRDEISREEKLIERLEGDFQSERKRHLLTAKQRKEQKVDQLAGGYTRLFSTLQIVRVWDRTLDGLITKCEMMKAAISDLGAQYYHVTRGSTARNLFMQTWPGFTRSKYRGFDLETSNHSLAALLPFSSTFTGQLENAEALFHGSTRNVVGLKTFAGATPQHMLVLGGTGAGKSVFMNVLLSQTEPDYHRTVIIEEGFSYATYTRTLGAEPIVLQLDGELTINYLDTNGLPLTHQHIGTAAALCLQMVGVSDSADVNKLRLGQLGEYINQAYDDAAGDWLMANPEKTIDLQRLGFALEKWRAQRMPGGSTFLDAWLDFLNVRRESPQAADDFLALADADEILAWAKTRDGETTWQRLIFAEWSHGDYANLTHSTIHMALRYSPMPHHDRKEINWLADMLGIWTRETGQRGKFFDGISNLDLKQRVLHFELSLIPESAADFKAAAGFLLNNVVRHTIMTDPRSWRKRIIFEEAPRFFNVPGGEDIVAASYATYRKYSTWLVAVAQQLSQIPEKLRPVLIGNSQLKIIFRQQSSADLELLARELRLPAVTVEAIRNHPSPEHLPASDRYSSCTCWSGQADRSLNGTIRVYACPEMLYLASSDGDVHEERAKALKDWPKVMDGILAEVAKRQAKAPQNS